MKWLTIHIVFGSFWMLLTCCASTVPADTVLTNGNIITVASCGNRVEALAIKGGKIISVGEFRTVQVQKTF